MPETDASCNNGILNSLSILRLPGRPDKTHIPNSHRWAKMNNRNITPISILSIMPKATYFHERHWCIHTDDFESATYCFDFAFLYFRFQAVTYQCAAFLRLLSASRRADEVTLIFRLYFIAIFFFDTRRQVYIYSFACQHFQRISMRAMIRRRDSHSRVTRFLVMTILELPEPQVPAKSIRSNASRYHFILPAAASDAVSVAQYAAAPITKRPRTGAITPYSLSHFKIVSSRICTWFLEGAVLW